MDCCHCQDIDGVFDDQLAERELSRYRLQGPRKETRMLIGALVVQGIQGYSLLDIGGGIGAAQYGLLEAGCQAATDVDASRAYLRVAKEEARRRGLADRVSYQHGNFVDLAPSIPSADIVTLDRVICCYPDMEKLVSLSAARAGKLYGLVFPRDTWLMRLGFWLINFFLRLRRTAFRVYPHSTRRVEALVASYGFQRAFYHRTSFWQVIVYVR